MKKRNYLFVLLIIFALCIVYWLYYSPSGLLTRTALWNGAQSDEFKNSLISRNDPLSVNAALKLLRINMENTDYGYEIHEGGFIALMILKSMGSKGFDAVSALLYSDRACERQVAIEFCWSSPLRTHVYDKIVEIAKEDSSLVCRFEANMRLAEISPAADLSLCEILLENEEKEEPYYCKFICANGIVTRNVIETLLTICCKYRNQSPKWNEFVNDTLEPYINNFTELGFNGSNLNESLLTYQKVKPFTYLSIEQDLYSNYIYNSYKSHIEGFSEIDLSNQDSIIYYRQDMGLGTCRILKIASKQEKYINQFTGEYVNQDFEKMYLLLEDNYRKLVNRYGK